MIMRTSFMYVKLNVGFSVGFHLIFERAEKLKISVANVLGDKQSFDICTKENPISF